MWIMMSNAMLSIVEDIEDERELMVRARRREDLSRVFPDYEPYILESHDTDYQFRLFLDRATVMVAIMKSIDAINYANFKGSVQERDRAWIYTRVWSELLHLQEE